MRIARTGTGGRTGVTTECMPSAGRPGHRLPNGATAPAIPGRLPMHRSCGTGCGGTFPGLGQTRTGRHDLDDEGDAEAEHQTGQRGEEHHRPLAREGRQRRHVGTGDDARHARQSGGLVTRGGIGIAGKEALQQNAVGLRLPLQLAQPHFVYGSIGSLLLELAECGAQFRFALGGDLSLLLQGSGHLAGLGSQLAVQIAKLLPHRTHLGMIVQIDRGKLGETPLQPHLLFAQPLDQG